MTLVDGSGRPVTSEGKANGETPNGEAPNGEAKSEEDEFHGDRSVRRDINDVDMRSIASGTLFYNISVFASQEIRIHNDIQYLEAKRAMKRQVAPDPRVQQLTDQIRKVQIGRHQMVSEFNERFRAFDAAWCARHNIEPYQHEISEDPKDDEENLPEE